MTRDEIQSEALSNIHKPNVILKWATGVGKSLGFIRMQMSLQPKSTYIVVAERAHIKNWTDEYKKHGQEHLLENTKIFCYASLSKYINTEVDLICLDEGHHVVTDLRLEALQQIRRKNLILLSATITKKDINILTESVGKFVITSLDLKEAIESDILPEPTIYVTPLKLDNALKIHTIEFMRGKKEKRVHIRCDYKEMWTYKKNKAKYPNLHLTIVATAAEKYAYIDKQEEYYKKLFYRTSETFAKNKWLFSGIERKRFLAECKTNIVKDFLLTIQKRRFVCFCGSIAQARILSENKNLVCSEVKNNQQIIDAFNDKAISNLFTVDMLKEGSNLSNIEIGVMVQLDGNEGSFIQKSGRIMRAENPVIFLFYFKNTKDEEYLENVLKEVNPEHVKVISQTFTI
jgi:superfamily II DNA or RNA helicase